MSAASVQADARTRIQLEWTGVLPTDCPFTWPSKEFRLWPILSAHVHEGKSVDELAEQNGVRRSDILGWLNVAEANAWHCCPNDGAPDFTAIYAQRDAYVRDCRTAILAKEWAYANAIRNGLDELDQQILELWRVS